MNTGQRRLIIDTLLLAALRFERLDNLIEGLGAHVTHNLPDCFAVALQVMDTEKTIANNYQAISDYFTDVTVGGKARTPNEDAQSITNFLHWVSANYPKLKL